MFGKKDGSPKAAISTLIGAGTLFEGDVQFSGGLRIDGTVRGNVKAESDGATVIISEEARVEGEVRADHVVINGTVAGAVHTQGLELQQKGRIFGDIRYTSLEMHPGAVVQGFLTPVTAEPLALPGLKLATNGG